MKYIITRDGTIIDLERVVDGNKLIHLNENEIKGGNFSGWYWKTGKTYYQMCRDLDVIKQFNTIEELCDEFVLFIDNKPYAIVPNKKYNAKLAHDVWKDYRGAIWTDKGLIYVAKINDKGELELL